MPFCLNRILPFENFVHVLEAFKEMIAGEGRERERERERERARN